MSVLDNKGVDEILLEMGKISIADFKKVLDYKRKSNKKIEDILIEFGLASKEDIMSATATKYGTSYVDLDNFRNIDRSILSQIPKEIILRYNLLPLELIDGELSVAMSDTEDIYLIDDLRLATGLEIKPILADENKIKQKIDVFVNGKPQLPPTRQNAPVDSPVDANLRRQGNAPVERRDPIQNVGGTSQKNGITTGLNEKVPQQERQNNPQNIQKPQNNAVSLSNGSIRGNDAVSSANGTIRGNNAVSPANGAIRGNNAVSPANGGIRGNNAVSPANAGIRGNNAVSPANGGIRGNNAVSPANGGIRGNNAVSPANGGIRGNNLVSPSNGSIRANNTIEGKPESFRGNENNFAFESDNSSNNRNAKLNIPKQTFVNDEFEDLFGNLYAEIPEEDLDFGNFQDENEFKLLKNFDEDIKGISNTNSENNRKTNSNVAGASNRNIQTGSNNKAGNGKKDEDAEFGEIFNKFTSNLEKDEDDFDSFLNNSNFEGIDNDNIFDKHIDDESNFNNFFINSDAINEDNNNDNNDDNNNYNNDSENDYDNGFENDYENGFENDDLINNDLNNNNFNSYAPDDETNFNVNEISQETLKDSNFNSSNKNINSGIYQDTSNVLNKRTAEGNFCNNDDESTYDSNPMNGNALPSFFHEIETNINFDVDFDQKPLFKEKLGAYLVKNGAITESQLEEALEIQKTSGDFLGIVLIKKGYIKRKTLYGFLEKQLGVRYIDLDTIEINSSVLALVSESLAKMHNIVPFAREEMTLKVAMSDPLNLFSVDDLRMTTGMEIQTFLADEEQIKGIIDIYYDKIRDSSEVFKKMQEIELLDKEFKKVNQEVAFEIMDDLEEEAEDENIEDAPIVKLVNVIFQGAVSRRASDIHIEPQEDGLLIRYRVDGELADAMTQDKKVASSLIARIKIISGLNIAEKRIPQDGRITVNINKKPYDMRVSVLPTMFGEKIVIRIADKEGFNVTKEQLGFCEEDMRKFNSILQHPHGVVLVTGPTGSGKSTTLYTALKELSQPNVNITTVEDPVECTIKGINQTQVNVKAGLTFAVALRSFLRQDPDIIMLGEIRDTETAEIAIRAAITGHLVLSTLHTNDAPSTITRIIDMGIEPYLISSAIEGIIAQRLVRKLCKKCKKDHLPTNEEKEILGLTSKDNKIIYEAIGCEECNSMGYKGRIAIHEVMTFNREIRDLIAKNVTSDILKDAAKKNGLVSLRDNCIRLIKQGITTIEELSGISQGEE